MTTQTTPVALTKMQRRALGALTSSADWPITTTEVADFAGIESRTAELEIRNLVAAGHVERVGRTICGTPTYQAVKSPRVSLASTRVGLLDDAAGCGGPRWPLNVPVTPRKGNL